VSPDEKMLVTTGTEDCMIKFFEIASFDMSNMISVSYVPTSAVWLSASSASSTSSTSGSRLCDRVAIADRDNGTIRVYKINGAQQHITQLDVHAFPVLCMSFNVHRNCVVSADSRGLIEYWDAHSFEQPSIAKQQVMFSLKTDTDLYDLAKTNAKPLSMAMSPTGLFYNIFL
jgi:peptidylprolyl isomerase domain and WD repeat-containing protein 1